MSLRQLVVLGSASQVPTRHRNHNGYLLRWDGHGFLFDPGEGTQRQMTIFGVPASAITRVLVSHFHGDHCLGLPGTLQRLSLDDVKHEVTVHYPGSGQVYFDRLRRASIYDDRAHITPAPVSADGLVADVPDLTIEARRLDHRVDAYGYRIAERDGVRFLPERLKQHGVKGRAITELSQKGSLEIDGRTVTLDQVSVPRPGQKAAFVMDTRLCDAAFELAKGVDLLICESTYLHADRQLAHDHGHLTAVEAATIAREAGARRLVLTHFSRRYPSADPFLEEAREIFEDCVVARDGLKVGVPPRRPIDGEPAAD